MILSTIFSPAKLFTKFTVALFALLKPLGIWGLGALAILDSSSIPMPIDALVIGYIAQDRTRFVLYAFIAALGSAIGGLLPYYLGRAGGELFLLKRINRERYESIRDRFEKQEFLAIMVPAMMPPPTPVKLFMLAAGVFEMRILPYFLAILVGKFVRFLAWGAVTVFFGQQIVHTVSTAIHQHSSIVLGITLVAVLILAVYVLRRIFDKRKGTVLPIEETASSTPTEFIPPAE